MQLRKNMKSKAIPFPEINKDSIIMGRNLKLKVLEENFDKTLNFETEESLKEWLNKKRKL